MFCKPLKTVCMATVLSFMFYSAHTQTHAYQRHQVMRRLDIGDTLPSVILGHFLHQSGKEIPISQLYRNGMLLINFWATWCGSCIPEISFLDSMVSAHNDSLQVLSVAYEDEKTVGSFLQKRKDIKTSHLHLLTGDTLLTEYFQHIMFPHNIWVDAKGIVRQITGKEDVTGENIGWFLKKGPLPLVKFKKDVIDFDWHKTFHLRDSSFLYRSILSSYTQNIPGGYSIFPTKLQPADWQVNRFFCFNLSLDQIIWPAYKYQNRWFTNQVMGRMQIRTRDSTKFYWPVLCPLSYKKKGYATEEDWRNQHIFCYELTLAHAVSSPTLARYVFDDLERNFNIRIFKEIQPIPCTILKKNEKSRLPNPIPSIQDTSFIRLDKNAIVSQKVDLVYLLEWLNGWLKDDLNGPSVDLPYINQTGINYLFDFKMEFPEQGRSSALFRLIRKCLSEKYGIEFTQQSHSYPVLIVQDLD